MTDRPRNVVLIGLRASGKTTVGRLLAESLGRSFVDLDDRVLETFEEPTVQAVWAARGEAAWREAEALVVDEVLATGGQVVALGGGAAMIDAVRRRLSRDDVDVVYLRCRPEVLAGRLAAEVGDRPALLGDDAVTEVDEVHAVRDPVYVELAELVIDADAIGPDEAADAIKRASACGPSDACG